MDRKAFRFKVNQLGADGTFQGFASVFGNRDLVDDIVERGAFAKSLNDAKGAADARGDTVLFPFLWQHDSREPVGGITAAEEQAKGLAVDGFIDLDTEQGKRAYSTMKKSYVRGFSIGYDTVVSEYDKAADVRRLKEIKLWEVSLVTFPANTEAGVTMVKSATSFRDLPLAARSRAWDADGADARLRAWAGGEDIDWKKYSKGFMWVDSEDAEKFGSYKLGFADVVNGTLTAIPRGIFACAAVMQGSRGGVNMPDTDRAAVKRHIARYYDKMRTEFEDETIVAPWETEASSFDVGLYTAIGAASDIKADEELTETKRELVSQALETLKALPGASTTAPAAATETEPPADSHGEGSTEDRKAFDDAFATVLAGVRTAAN